MPTERRHERLRDGEDGRADDEERRELDGGDHRAPRRRGGIEPAAPRLGNARHASVRPSARDRCARCRRRTAPRGAPPRRRPLRDPATARVQGAPRERVPHRSHLDRGAEAECHDHGTASMARVRSTRGERRLLRRGLGARAQVLDPRAVERDEGLQRPRQAAVDRRGDAVRRADQPRRGQRGERGHRDHDRIQERRGHAVGEADAGDDERELADLGEAHPGLDRVARPAAEQEGADRDRDRLAGDHEPGEQQHLGRVASDLPGVDLHADGDEEDGGEQVAHGLDSAARPVSCSPDSATSDPAMNAPSATE